jgi:biotin-dependent carboxylase-like uncharacterized protein
MIIFSEVKGFVTLQDGGRIGVAHLAIPTSGAFDKKSHNLANRIVGNSQSAATIESLRSSFSFISDSGLVLAVTGAPVNIRINGVQLHMNAALHVPAGVTVEISSGQLAMRTYVAVRGGFVGETVIGSQSYDELSKLGTAPLATGQQLTVGNDFEGEVASAHAVVKGVHLGSHFVADVSIGPRWEMFPEAQQLFAQTFTVSGQCNRIAVRLEGYSFSWDTETRLPSEGVVYGAIQVPVDGQPLIFGPDHPTTGGYPVIGVVAESDMSVIAQLPPGATLQFKRSSN